MKRIVSLILIGLLVASGVDAMAQSKGKKTSRKGKKTDGEAEDGACAQHGPEGLRDLQYAAAGG